MAATTASIRRRGFGTVWIASCPTCGFQLATARAQERVERKAARRSCPICVEVA